MRILKDKKGQPQWETIIWIVAILILIFSVLILTNTFSLKDIIFGAAGGKATIDREVSNCKIDCLSQATNNYNLQVRDITFADGFKTKATCRQLESPISACMDASGKVIAGVASQSDCEGVTDSAGLNGAWNEGEKCYQIGMNNALAPLKFSQSFTVAMCLNNPKTYVYLKEGVCLVNLKPILTADTKVKCEGQGTWSSKEPAQIKEVCTTV